MAKMGPPEVGYVRKDPPYGELVETPWSEGVWPDFSDVAGRASDLGFCDYTANAPSWANRALYFARFRQVFEQYLAVFRFG